MTTMQYIRHQRQYSIENWQIKIIILFYVVFYRFSGDYALLCPEHVLPEFIIHTTFSDYSLRPSSSDYCAMQSARGKRYYSRSFLYLWGCKITIINFSSRDFLWGCVHTLDDDTSNEVRRLASKKQEIAFILENTSAKFLEARKKLFEKQISILQLQFPCK